MMWTLTGCMIDRKVRGIDSMFWAIVKPHVWDRFIFSTLVTRWAEEKMKFLARTSEP